MTYLKCIRIIKCLIKKFFSYFWCKRIPFILSLKCIFPKPIPSITKCSLLQRNHWKPFFRLPGSILFSTGKIYLIINYFNLYLFSFNPFFYFFFCCTFRIVFISNFFMASMDFNYYIGVFQFIYSTISCALEIYVLIFNAIIKRAWTFSEVLFKFWNHKFLRTLDHIIVIRNFHFLTFLLIDFNDIINSYMYILSALSI